MLDTTCMQPLQSMGREVVCAPPLTHSGGRVRLRHCPFMHYSVTRLGESCCQLPHTQHTTNAVAKCRKKDGTHGREEVIEQMNTHASLPVCYKKAAVCYKKQRCDSMATRVSLHTPASSPFPLPPPATS